MRIVAVAGRLVRDFVTQRPVDAEGIDIDPTHPTWARLISDGDVAEAPPATTPPADPATDMPTAEDDAPGEPASATGDAEPAAEPPAGDAAPATEPTAEEHPAEQES